MPPPSVNGHGSNGQLPGPGGPGAELPPRGPDFR
jgi:hypothetical protein